MFPWEPFTGVVVVEMNYFRCEQTDGRTDELSHTFHRSAGTSRKRSDKVTHPHARTPTSWLLRTISQSIVAVISIVACWSGIDFQSEMFFIWANELIGIVQLQYIRTTVGLCYFSFVTSRTPRFLVTVQKYSLKKTFFIFYINLAWCIYIYIYIFKLKQPILLSLIVWNININVTT